MAVKMRNLRAAAKKVNKRQVRIKKHPSNLGYRHGHTDGFNKGRTDGFAEGRRMGIERGQIEVKEEKLHAVIITPGIIPSLEIGILQPLNEVNNQTEYRYEVRVEGDVTRELIEKTDTVIFLRNVEPAAYEYLEWAHQLGKRTIYVIDDNFLEIPPTTPMGLYYSDSVRKETFIKFLKNAQLVKVDASWFGNYIRTRFNQNVIYFPASVDFSMLDQMTKPVREDGQIVIGYAGGHKAEEFAPVVEALLKILYEYGGFVRVEFLGYVPAQLISHPGVSSIEVEPGYSNYLRRLYECSWDFALAPLSDTVFNNCKTNNKFREYSACGIPGIYSDLTVYKEWVSHGETGYLVPHTPKGWFSGIKTMIENPALRLGMKEKATAVARQHFSVLDCAEKWRSQVLHI